MQHEAYIAIESNSGHIRATLRPLAKSDLLYDLIMEQAEMYQSPSALPTALRETWYRRRIKKVDEIPEKSIVDVRFHAPGNNPSSKIIEAVANHPLTQNDFFTLMRYAPELTGNEVGNIIRKQYNGITADAIVRGEKVWENAPLPGTCADDIRDELDHKYSTLLKVLNDDLSQVQ